MKAKSIYTVMLGVFLLASCNNEDTPLQAGQDSDAPAMNLPEGTFVVDYTASTDGAASRSANGMISSLDYLLYESTDGSTYTLAKRVEIPDIDKGKTNWPLIRENMTWAQREALKDTLNTSNSYKAVFVANADAEKVWDGETVLTNVDLGLDFTEARLNLPTQKSFDASNMYFMDVVEVKAPTDGNNYVNQKVLLERVINKIEVKLDEEIATEIAGEQYKGDVEAYVTAKLEEFYSNNYVKVSDDGTISGKLYESVQTYMNGIVTKINSSIPTNETLYGRQIKDKKIFRDEYIIPGIVDVINNVSECDVESPCSGETYCVKHWLFNKIYSVLIKNCNWNQVQTIEVEYANENYPNSIDFLKRYYVEKRDNQENAESIKINVPKENNRYIWYTLGMNSGETSTFGKVSSISFKDNNGTELFLLSCEENLNASGGNQHFVYVYNPIKAMSIGNVESYSKSGFNMESVLEWDLDDTSKWEYADDSNIAGWTKKRMEQWVNGLFDEDNKEQDGDFIPYTLKLSIPQISIVDPWTVSNE